MIGFRVLGFRGERPHVEAGPEEFKFQPPPGLEKPEELQFFTEIPGRAPVFCVCVLGV